MRECWWVDNKTKLYYIKIRGTSIQLSEKGNILEIEISDILKYNITKENYIVFYIKDKKELKYPVKLTNKQKVILIRNLDLVLKI